MKTMVSKIREKVLEIVCTMFVGAFVFAWQVNADISAMKEKDKSISEKLDLVIELIQADKLENSKEHREIIRMLRDARQLANSGFSTSP